MSDGQTAVNRKEKLEQTRLQRAKEQNCALIESMRRQNEVNLRRLLLGQSNLLDLRKYSNELNLTIDKWDKLVDRHITATLVPTTLGRSIVNLRSNIANQNQTIDMLRVTLAIGEMEIKFREEVMNLLQEHVYKELNTLSTKLKLSQEPIAIIAEQHNQVPAEKLTIFGMILSFFSFFYH